MQDTQTAKCEKQVSFILLPLLPPPIYKAGSRELKESEGIKGVCSGECAMKVMEAGERRKVCILSLAEKERLILEMYMTKRVDKHLEWIREHDKQIRELCHAVPGACW